uniref:Organic anion transmembrane transporter n=1 Tax=Solanum tuberosum TaxID=4113 RepID=M1CN54_SOLTU
MVLLHEHLITYEVVVLCAAIAGVAAYNNHKLKKGTSQASSDESEPTVPLIQSSNSNK